MACIHATVSLTGSRAAGSSGQDADGSHLVGANGPLWWLRTGYEHTHTDGDPLRVARRWTCWLLICSDQWFTTWSSVSGGPAPTVLAQWRWHTGQTSPRAQVGEVSGGSFCFLCPLLLVQNSTNHFLMFFSCLFITSAWLFAGSLWLFLYLPLCFLEYIFFSLNFGPHKSLCQKYNK